MAKILLADDNSNVHKTVALALEPLGIEVFSVNNGDAAVKKLADFSPDLVLADIFMPVRSGYEVCEYVKKIPKFAHVPVVLLVGAFDPLDEREAQRVGADGILKKPFVPPDPLITMVKSLLQRLLSERPAEVSEQKDTIPVLATVGQGSNGEQYVSSSEISAESSSQEFPAPAERVVFGDAEPPVAFGNLLEASERQHSLATETDVIDPVDTEQVLTHSRDTTLGDPIFWKNDSSEEVKPVEDSQKDSTGLEPHAWAQPDDSTPGTGEFPLLQPIEPLEFVREEQDETSPSIVDSEPIQLDPAAQASLTVESSVPEDLALNPIEWLATAPAELSEADSVPTPGWDEPVLDATGPIEPLEMDPVELSIQPDSDIHSQTEIAKEITSQLVQESKQDPEDIARSVPVNDWDELSATVHASAAELTAQPVGSAPDAVAQIPSVEIQSTQAPAAISAQASAPDPALVEAVVQRVIDKVGPQVIDIITREFLRPIVQAIVHRTIEKG